MDLRSRRKSTSSWLRSSGGRARKRNASWRWAGRSLAKECGGWVATALGVMGMATYGLGFGLLMHKKTRDYITTHIAVKRFPLSTPGEAAMSIVETFRVLAPAARTVVASKSTAPHP